MNFDGIIIGLATFLIIGVCHPIVIKSEYYFGKRCWWVFLLAGFGFMALSLLVASTVWSVIAGVAAFSAFWSILELFEQEKRVAKGWFPRNPKKQREGKLPSVGAVDSGAQKIYFAGSIRGGRSDAELYKEMIAFLQQKHIVLTEHVGDLSKSAFEGQADSERSIYEQDTAWLREADVVIAECTTPSLGVGYELAYAEKYGKPVHIFYDRSRTRLSAMLKGNKYYHIHPYTSREELFSLLSDWA